MERLLQRAPRVTERPVVEWAGWRSLQHVGYQAEPAAESQHAGARSVTRAAEGLAHEWQRQRVVGRCRRPKERPTDHGNQLLWQPEDVHALVLRLAALTLGLGHVFRVARETAFCKRADFTATSTA